MSAQRKYYLFALVVFCLGAVLALTQAAWTALGVFLVLASMMFWIQGRVDRFIEQRHGTDRTGV